MKKPRTLEDLAEEFLYTEVDHDEKHDSLDHEKEMKALLKVLRKIQSDERERCAKLVESMDKCCSLPYDEYHGVCHTNAAKLIREG